MSLERKKGNVLDNDHKNVAQKTIHDPVVKKNNTRILKLCLNARYHESCQRDYTRSKKKTKSNVTEEDTEDAKTLQTNKKSIFKSGLDLSE